MTPPWLVPVAAVAIALFVLSGRPAAVAVAAPPDASDGADFLTAQETEVVRELNRARQDPAAYAEHLVEMKDRFTGTHTYDGDRGHILTREGLAAVDEAIGFLRLSRPLPPLAVSRGLSRAARDHATDQGIHGVFGHVGSDGSQPAQRASRYGQWLEAMGENIDYGNRVPRDIVVSQIIDDGVADRGHRRNIFDSRFTLVGVACGPNLHYEYMCVMDFAAGFREKPGR